MSEYEKIEVYLKKETVEFIKKIVEFENAKNLIHNNERFSSFQIQDFISGCINTYIKEIRGQDVSSGLDDLGKPFRLRNRFKEIAKSKGMSQEKLAEMTNINPSNISLIFRNKNQPSLDYFLRIWIALNCPPLDKCLYREIEE